MRGGDDLALAGRVAVARPGRVSAASGARDLVSVETKALRHGLVVGRRVAVVSSNLDGGGEEVVGRSVDGLVHEDDCVLGRLDRAENSLGLSRGGAGAVTRVVVPIDDDVLWAQVSFP